MAKNIDVISNFVSFGNSGKTTNLRIEGDKLFNYNTVICERYRENGTPKFKVNVTKYSQSTTTIQNALLKLLAYDEIEVFTDIQMNAQAI